MMTAKTTITSECMGPTEHRVSSLSPLSALRLMQLNSPAMPIGAFAYSQGLEQAVERAWVTDTQSLRAWLGGLLRSSFGCTDLPLVARAMRTWREPTSQDTISALCDLVFALRETRELREEERHLGSSLARVLSRLGLTDADPYIGHERASYVVMYGLAAVRWELPLEQAISGFGFSWLENQLAAASRLIKLGQLDAQAILSELMLDLPQVARRALDIKDADIGQTLPALAMASSWHEEQYSRLFRS